MNSLITIQIIALVVSGKLEIAIFLSLVATMELFAFLILALLKIPVYFN